MHRDMPSTSSRSAAGDAAAPATISAPSAGTLMVVDDERGIREMLRRVLERAGYRVLTAAQGGEALARFEEAAGAIDLVITDVRMPEMSGPELADRLATLREGVKILYISGYGGAIVAPHDPFGIRSVFLQKPFTMAALLEKVKEMLAGDA